VETEKGRYLIIGDLCYNMTNYNENIPTGVYTSLYGYYASFAGDAHLIVYFLSMF